MGFVVFLELPSVLVYDGTGPPCDTLLVVTVLADPGLDGFVW